jgi:membrane-bound lytic murein transglycosylase D
MAAALMLPLAACSSAIDSSNDSSNQISVSGLVASTQNISGPLGQGEAAVIASVQPNNDTSAQSLPFVRNNPASVPPFPLELNQAVQQYVDGYLSQPTGLERSFKRIKPYMAEMTALLRHHGLPSDLVYLTFAESGFSDTGAGPWQLNRDTARRFGLLINQWVDERRDPIKSTRAAAQYLSDLHDQVGSDWRMTLVAWNNGEGGVDRYIGLSDASYNRMLMRLPRRTRSLLNRFMAVALIARQRRASGQLKESADDIPPYRILPVKGGTSLRTVAAEEHTSLQTLLYLNPALIRHCAPPGEETYPVRVPSGAVEANLSTIDF